MTGFISQFRTSLRLFGRNRMGLLYSYLFPLLFLVAFAFLYRDQAPLMARMGELLTIAILGGACFGFPTTLVNERERGVWRRFRLAPASLRSLVGGTIAARYASLLVAGLLQVVLAVVLAVVILRARNIAAADWWALLPLPAHPLGLLLAFTCVCFAFLGLGLVMATLADTVPAVQALGQCIFLPMLVIGGVAVRLDTLPEWALHLSAFFPGRYAVAAIQACYTGSGVTAQLFNIGALLLIGTSGCVAGAMMFRWDARQRFMEQGRRHWIMAAIAGWAAVGLAAEATGHVRMIEDDRPALAISTPDPGAGRPSAGGPGAGLAAALGQSAPAEVSADPMAPVESTDAVPNAATAASVSAPVQETRTWRDLQLADWWNWDYDSLPPDDGVISPIADPSVPLEPSIAEWVEFVRVRLPLWEPSKEADPVQRVRNILMVAAATDVAQLPIEAALPDVVLAFLRQDIGNDFDLARLLAWIVLHPGEGNLDAADELYRIGVDITRPPPGEVRRRTVYYAMKFLLRI
jgi:ABC-type multidrug transport system permease subunit